MGIFSTSIMKTRSQAAADCGKVYEMRSQSGLHSGSSPAVAGRSSATGDDSRRYFGTSDCVKNCAIAMRMTTAIRIRHPNDNLRNLPDILIRGLGVVRTERDRHARVPRVGTSVTEGTDS